MPVSLRPSGKATKIAESILGKPDSKKSNKVTRKPSASQKVLDLGFMNETKIK